MAVLSLVALLPTDSTGDASQPSQNSPAAPLTLKALTLKAFTLKACYELALAQSETLKSSAQNILQAETRYNQALSTILPNLKFNVSSLIQDVDTHNNPANARRETTLSKFTASQPLFRGFKEFAAMKGSKFETEKSKQLYKRASLLLYQDVAQTYFLIVRLEIDLKDVESFIQLTQERIAELKQRINLGKSRESELLSADSQLSSLLSNRESDLSAIAIARNLLSFLTGKEIGDTPLQSDLDSPTSLLSLDDAVKKALERSDLMAVKEEMDAQRYAIRIAQSDHWPAADVIGNYYTTRDGSLEPIKWDLLFNINLPLFSGGLVNANVKEARSIYEQARLDVERLTRQIKSDVKSVHLTLESSLRQSDFLHDAYLKAKKSYEIQVKEYRLGLVNNLEVLSALNTMEQTKQQWDGIQVGTKLNEINLRITVEDIP